MRTLIRPWLRWLALALAFAMPALASAQGDAKPFSKEQLDQLTAPVALYPDALLSQVLMASTYPANVASAAQWSRAHADAKGDDAVKMVENEPWDPSVQSLVAFPQVVIMMGEKPDWVKDLGDAFLAQPDDVMDSVQRLRVAAQKAGNLKSNAEVDVKVETAPPPTVVVEASAPPPPPQVIVIEQKNPQVIYVPAYNPTYVYGPWPYPAYPPYYIPYPPGYWFSAAVMTGIAWGVGIGVRNAVWGNCNWWNHSVNINVNRYNNINVNNRISNTNINNANWSHNVQNRGNVAYRGGDATRQNLQNRAQTVNREQYRGKDLDRQRAQQSLQNRGVSTDRAALSDANRGQLQSQAQSFDRGGAQNRAQSFDRSAAQNRNQVSNQAFQGVSDRQAGSEITRGAASRQSAQQMQRPQTQQRSQAQRPQAQQMQRSSGGGAARGGGGGGRGGGGRR